MHPATCRGHLIRTYTTIIDEGSILLIRSYFSAKCFFFRGLLPKWGKADMLHTCRHSICDSATKLKKKFFKVQLSVNRASIVSPFATKSWNHHHHHHHHPHPHHHHYHHHHWTQGGRGTEDWGGGNFISSFQYKLSAATTAQINKEPHELDEEQKYTTRILPPKAGVQRMGVTRVTLIVPACQPGWEEMENLRGNNSEWSQPWRKPHN